MAGNPDVRVPPPVRPPARHFALRLLGRTQDSAGDDTPGNVACAACDNLYWELSRWIGFDGCHALFTRALGKARIDHPSLSSIVLRVRSDPYVEGVGQSIASHGDAAVAAALESMLVQVVDLLGRIIGDDLAAKLMEQSIATAGGSGDAGNTGSRNGT